MCKCNRKEKKYLWQRKMGVLKIRKLIKKRDGLTKEIKDVRGSLNAWDNALVTN